MSEEQGIFQPTEMEIDRSSKLSLLEHISYRLRLPDRLDHSDNGHLDGGQMLELTKAVISESEGYDSTDLKAMNQHLKHLYQKMLDQVGRCPVPHSSCIASSWVEIHPSREASISAPCIPTSVI